MLVGGEALDQMKTGPGAIREFRAAVDANPREANVAFRSRISSMDEWRVSRGGEGVPGRVRQTILITCRRCYIWQTRKIQMSQMDEATPLLEKTGQALVRKMPLAHLDLGIPLRPIGTQAGGSGRIEALDPSLLLIM